jgi:hypothetical protein
MFENLKSMNGMMIDIWMVEGMNEVENDDHDRNIRKLGN